MKWQLHILILFVHITFIIFSPGFTISYESRKVFEVKSVKLSTSNCSQHNQLHNINTNTTSSTTTITSTSKIMTTNLGKQVWAVSGWGHGAGGAEPAAWPKCKKKIEEEKCKKCDHTFFKCFDSEEAWQDRTDRGRKRRCARITPIDVDH